MAVDLGRYQVNGRRITFLPDGWQVIAGGMPTPMVESVLSHTKDAVQVLFTHHAESVEHFVLERLNHPLDVRLEGSATGEG